MAEIRCPHCGEVFQVDEKGYAQIVAQVRDAELERMVHERLAQAEDAHRKDLALALERAGAASQRDLASRDAEIARLRASVQEAANERDLAVMRATQELGRQVVELEGKVREAAAERERQAEADARQLAEERALRERELRDKDLEMERVLSQRSRLNTKMLGESLEQHCEMEFNKVRAMAFPRAEFSKDTVAVSDGEGDRPTKGDYIFRELDDDGNEVISIMFEMKTEQADATRHLPNSAHLKKLDADRRKKGCEYAVLVSTLEPDNDFYNQGIVESWEYQKMYVIRPQFFIPLIGLLRNMALGSMEYRRELAQARRQNVDVTNFEEKMERFKEGFARDVERAGKNFGDAIKEIDSAIDQLQKVRASLTKSQDYLGRAQKKADDQLTIRKLSYRNPTMKAAFEEARAARADSPEAGDPEAAQEPDRVE